MVRTISTIYDRVLREPTEQDTSITQQQVIQMGEALQRLQAQVQELQLKEAQRTTTKEEEHKAKKEEAIQHLAQL